jgi:hypothetical protein
MYNMMKFNRGGPPFGVSMVGLAPLPFLPSAIVEKLKSHEGIMKSHLGHWSVRPSAQVLNL